MTSSVPDFLRRRFKELPQRPGVYLFKDRDSKLVYVGKALSIRKRVLSHFRGFGHTGSKQGLMLSEIRRIDFIETATEADALLLEASLVKEHLPKFNQELKDDKSYPYLKITNEAFPRLLIVRSRRSDGGKYFGPYTSARLLRQAVKMLRRLFPLRTCDPMPDRVCLMYHIGQCKGPCVAEIDKDRTHAIVKELELFLEGRHAALVRGLSQRMREYSKRRNYEKAKSVYEQIRALASLPQPDISKKRPNQVLAAMKDAFLLPKEPERMEGYDISNISGQEAVGSMVVFLNGKPARSEYRRFRIKTVQGINDYDMMREVIRRRFTRMKEEKQAPPDLVVIDGGKGHLSSAWDEMGRLGIKGIPMISIAKQHEHIFEPSRETPHIYPQNSPLLQLLQRLRDEAHRFAISYHRRLHRKEAFISRLDTIRGVGPKTKEKLLKKFGTVSALAKADPEEIHTRCAVSCKTAKKIVEILADLTFISRIKEARRQDCVLSKDIDKTLNK